MDYIAIGLLFAVILVQTGVIVMLILAAGKERERLLDRIQAPEASVAAAFAYQPTPSTPPAAPEFEFDPPIVDPDLTVLDFATKEQ